MMGTQAQEILLLDMFQNEFKKMHEDLVEKELKLFHQLFQHLFDNSKRLEKVERFLEQQFANFEGPIIELEKEPANKKRRKRKRNPHSQANQEQDPLIVRRNPGSGSNIIEDRTISSGNEDFDFEEAEDDDGTSGSGFGGGRDEYSQDMLEEEEATMVLAKTEPETDEEEEFVFHEYGKNEGAGGSTLNSHSENDSSNLPSSSPSSPSNSDDGRRIEVIMSKKHKPKALLSGFQFEINRESSDKKTWRCCSYYQTGCRVRIITNTDLSNLVLISQTWEHNHSESVPRGFFSSGCPSSRKHRIKW